VVLTEYKKYKITVSKYRKQQYQNYRNYIVQEKTTTTIRENISTKRRSIGKVFSPLLSKELIYF